MNMMECLNGCYGLFIFNRNEARDTISYVELEALTSLIQKADRNCKCYTSHGWSANIVPVTVSAAIGTLAPMQARGTGYDLFRFNQLTLVQCLFLILFKGRNGQSMLGKGWTEMTSHTSTGSNNTPGRYINGHR